MPSSGKKDRKPEKKLEKALAIYGELYYNEYINLYNFRRAIL